MKRVVISGGGPIGCYVGHLLAKAKYQVTILEENKEVGKPIQCTGILTGKIRRVLAMHPDFLVNTIKKTRVFSPKKKFADFPLDDNYIVSRYKFDSHFANLAKKSNATILLNATFTKFDKETNTVHFEEKGVKKSMQTDILIGCDGPKSKVYSLINTRKRKNWMGLQATAELKNENAVEFYPGFTTYAWVVPENASTVRIGIAFPDGPNALKQFTKFLKYRLGDNYKKQLLEYQAGLIPEYDPKICCHKDNIYLIGDAGAQVKATTGGGLVPGLLAAECCAEAIIHNKNYHKLKRGIDANLKAHLYLRNMLDRFKEKDWENIIAIFQEKKMSKLLETYDRDSPIKLLFAIFLRKPSLIRYTKYLTPKLL